MNKAIIDRFNSMVSEKDHTYILGDIGFCKPETTLEFLKEMNGTKTIVFGNHDKPLSKFLRNSSVSTQNLCGVTDYCEYKEINVSVDGVSNKIVLFHFKIAGWNGMHHGAFHFHGHEHGTGKGHPGRCKDIGVDTNNLYPYDLESLIGDLKTKPLFFEGHHDESR